MRNLQKNEMREIVSSEIKFDCSFKKYTSLGVGGPAEALVKVDKKDELQELLAFLKTQKIPWRVIGRGTNLLVSDKGFAGVVLVLGRDFKNLTSLKSGSSQRKNIFVGGGYSLTRLTSDCADLGFGGLEFSCGIPGSLGGAVIMNAGAWGSEISQVVRFVEVTTAVGVTMIPADQLDFSYRCCEGFGKYLGSGVVTGVELELSAMVPEAILQRCSELRAKRRTSQKVFYPNAGSFFKNPPGDSAGRLIDIAGLKGKRVGGAMVSEAHGNFIVNRDNATASDILSLIALVQNRVKEKHGILLEPEVHFLGF
jgi:UDP-N-acetylmuramate dehydrogenase